MNDSLCCRGHYSIIAIDACTGAQVWRKDFDNLLTVLSRDIRTSLLMGDGLYNGDELAIKYMGFGDNATPATINDSRLANELYRKQVTKKTVFDPSNVQTIVSLAPLEANFVIREIGVFCGPRATSTANSGLLLSRVTVFIENNSNLILNIVRNDITKI